MIIFIFGDSKTEGLWDSKGGWADRTKCQLLVEYSDISLYESIQTAWFKGKDIFSLYGSGHAIILEKALSQL